MAKAIIEITLGTITRKFQVESDTESKNYKTIEKPFDKTAALSGCKLYINPKEFAKVDKPAKPSK